MGIINWFKNDLNSEERALTRDLVSVAIADHEFSEEEQKTILEICSQEGISTTELMNSIRDKKAGAKVLHTLDERKRYLLHLIRLMSVDGNYTFLELHLIEVIAKEIEVSPAQILSFIIEDVKDSNISKDDCITILDQFISYFIASGIRL